MRKFYSAYSLFHLSVPAALFAQSFDLMFSGLTTEMPTLSPLRPLVLGIDEEVVIIIRLNNALIKIAALINAAYNFAAYNAVGLVVMNDDIAELNRHLTGVPLSEVAQLQGNLPLRISTTFLSHISVIISFMMRELSALCAGRRVL